MTLAEFNESADEIARAELLRCCGSVKWADAIVRGRPFHDGQTLFSVAESVWWALEPADWLQAFSAHPRIGAQTSSAWSSDEQSGVDSGSKELLDRLAKGNEQYEAHFGWFYLVNASGKTGYEMLELLHSRLNNESAEEMRVAAGEQAKITRLRLHKMLDL